MHCIATTSRVSVKELVDYAVSRVAFYASLSLDVRGRISGTVSVMWSRSRISRLTMNFNFFDPNVKRGKNEDIHPLITYGKMNLYMMMILK